MKSVCWSAIKVERLDATCYSQVDTKSASASSFCFWGFQDDRVFVVRKIIRGARIDFFDLEPLNLANVSYGSQAHRSTICGIGCDQTI